DRVPHQRRRPVELRPFARAHHLVAPAGRTGHSRRFARVSELLRAAELRLDDRQSDRLRRLARASDGAHARRTVGNDRRGHQDQHPAAPGIVARRQVHAGWRVHSLPRRTNGEKEGMSFIALRFDTTASEAEAWSDALLDAGALSIDVSDPFAGTDM